MAKERLPDYSKNFYAGNAWLWTSPVKFNYVRTETVYVPDFLQKQYLERIINEYLTDGGKLLVTEYRSRKDPISKLTDVKASDFKRMPSRACHNF